MFFDVLEVEKQSDITQYEYHKDTNTQKLSRMSEICSYFFIFPQYCRSMQCAYCKQVLIIWYSILSSHEMPGDWTSVRTDRIRFPPQLYKEYLKQQQYRIGNILLMGKGNSYCQCLSKDIFMQFFLVCYSAPASYALDCHTILIDNK